MEEKALSGTSLIVIDLGKTLCKYLAVAIGVMHMGDRSLAHLSDLAIIIIMS